VPSKIRGSYLISEKQEAMGLQERQEKIACMCVACCRISKLIIVSLGLHFHTVF
jgi:hypothetical protein